MSEANFIIRARDRTREAFMSAESRMTRFSRTSRMALGGFGAGLSVAGLVRYGRQALSTADQIDNLATRLRLGTESVQTLGVITREAGLNIESFQTLIDRLGQQTDQARNGNIKAIESFQALGITLEDLERMTPEQTLEAVARSMVRHEGDARAAVAATDLLGARSGRLQGVLRQLGEQGFEALNAQMLASAQIMEQDMVRAGDRMEEGLSRAFNRMNIQASSFFIKMAAESKIFADGFLKEVQDMSWMERARLLSPGGASVEFFRRRREVATNMRQSREDLFRETPRPEPFAPAIGEDIAEPLEEAGDTVAEKIKNAFASFRADDLVNQFQRSVAERAQKALDQHTSLLATINRSIQDINTNAVGA